MQEILTIFNLATCYIPQHSIVLQGLKTFFRYVDSLELTVNKLTVGKIYAGLLIAENWKSYKATKVTQKNGGGPTGGGTAAVAGTASVSSCITVSGKTL